MATQQIPQIAVEQRDKLGSRPAKRLRDAGRIPAVIYGHKQNPMHVSTDYKQISTLLQRHSHVLEVVCGDKSESCLIKQVQWDHLGTELMHVDLARVDLKERVTVEIQIELVGDPVGLKEAHTYLEHNLNMITIECQASTIPESIEVDVSSLEANSSVTLADVKLPEGITSPMDVKTIIASTHMAAAGTEETEEVPVPEATAAEPELIGKKPGEGEGAEE